MTASKPRRATAAAPRPVDTSAPEVRAGGSRERILLAAERVFSERGYDGCTLKDIAARARVNQGMIHYFFRTKEAVFREAYMRRGREIADERLRLLDLEEASSPRPVALEKLIELFLRSAVNVALRGPGGRAFLRMQARLQMDASKFGQQIRGELYDESSRRFVAAFARSLPQLGEDEIAWRFVFMLGAYQYALADTGRLEVISKGRCSGRDFAESLRQIVPFLAAAMRAAGPRP